MTSKWMPALSLDERLQLAGKPAERASQPDLYRSWALRRGRDLRRVRHLDLSQAMVPRWLQRFDEDYATCRVRSTKRQGEDDLVWSMTAPLTRVARRTLRDAINAGPGTLFPKSPAGRRKLALSFEEILHDRLSAALMKVIVLELGVASKSGMLPGATGEDRYAFFAACLADPAFARALLAQYPVLVRRLVAIVENWCTSSLNLLAQFVRSAPLFGSSLLDGKCPGRLSAVESVGDTHRHGNAVHILTFESGQRIVYKPRDTGMELFYKSFVDWFNALDGDIDLKAARVLEADGCGWMEYIETRPCATLAQTEQFFVRQGATVALAYVLGGTDLHFENVIAHGEYPVLIDLETLFQVPLVDCRLPAATTRASEMLRTSVLATSLLPDPSFYGDDSKWIDWSALGNTDGQMTPVPVPVWRQLGTDDMRLAYDHVKLRGGTSLPQLDGAHMSALASSHLVLRGFRQAYTQLWSASADLLSANGPLQPARGHFVRHILRGTVFYADLAEHTAHPQYLLDAIKAEAALHRSLATSGDDIVVSNETEDSEVEQLLAGDIPHFTSVVGDDFLLIQRPEHAGLSANGWENGIARIQNLGEEDLVRQEALARAALTTEQHPAAPVANGGDRQCPPNEGQLLEAALSLGEHLLRSRIGTCHRSTWLTFMPIGEGRVATRIADPDIYDGLAGISLFLGFLGEIADDRRFSEAAIAGIEEAQELWRATDIARTQLGAYDGAAGLALVMARLAPIVGRPDWSVKASEIMLECLDRARKIGKWDVISGKAGILMAAISVTQMVDDPRLLAPISELARQISEAFANAERTSPRAFPKQKDAGVAHGRAGLAFALRRWQAMANETSHRPEYRIALDIDLATIERRAIRLAKRKTSDAADLSTIGWCRGWLGIGLAMLNQKGRLNADRGEAGILSRKIANEIIKKHNIGRPNYCHGALGHLEFMRQAITTGAIDETAETANWRRMMLWHLVSLGGSDGQIEGPRHPGLMTGIAGVGYALLREVRPGLVPSILTLDY